MIDLKHINCLEFMKQCKENQFDLAIVDPPYFNGPQKLGYYGASVSKTGVMRDGYEEIGTWEVPGKQYFDELLRVSKNQIIWGINYYASFIPHKGRIVWDKVNGKSSFSDAELASISMQDSVRLYSYMWNGFMQGKSLHNGKTQQGNKKLNEKRIHPTQKPVDLYKWLLMNYAKEGDSILDTHLGSGSIAIACHDLGFDLTGCEIDKQYLNAAQARLNKHKAKGTFL